MTNPDPDPPAVDMTLVSAIVASVIASLPCSTSGVANQLTVMTEKNQLNGKNWRAWWAMTEMILCSRNHLDIMSGNESRPDKSTHPNEYEVWEKKDNDA